MHGLSGLRVASAYSFATWALDPVVVVVALAALGLGRLGPEGTGVLRGLGGETLPTRGGGCPSRK